MKSTSKLLLLAEFSESQIAQIRSSAEATQLNANDVRYGLRIQGALKSKPLYHDVVIFKYTYI